MGCRGNFLVSLRVPLAKMFENHWLMLKKSEFSCKSQCKLFLRMVYKRSKPKNVSTAIKCQYWNLFRITRFYGCCLISKIWTVIKLSLNENEFSLYFIKRKFVDKMCRVSYFFYQAPTKLSQSTQPIQSSKIKSCQVKIISIIRTTTRTPIKTHTSNLSTLIYLIKIWIKKISIKISWILWFVCKQLTS